MRNELTDPRHFIQESNRANEIKGKACHGCKFMSVLERKKKSVSLPVYEWKYYNEYYCSKSGLFIKVADMPLECERRR